MNPVFSAFYLSKNPEIIYHGFHTVFPILLYFDHINAALVNIRDFKNIFKKKSSKPQTFE